MTHRMFADPLTMHQLARDLERIARGQGPTPAELRNAPLLTGWQVHPASTPVLVGSVTGHPERRDGAVVTSHLYALDFDHRLWARTMNRWYRLAEREPDIVG